MKPCIHVEKLRLKFPKEESLLFKDVSLSINKGEKVLLLGPSGCGKSTLLQVMAGIIPQSIEVPMKAEQVNIPSSTGYVFQDPDSQFCMPYVDEEIAFVLENLQTPRELMEEKIAHYLGMVGLNLSDLHTKIQILSGGQKQRVAIASTLALEPEVLFLDEPTAMLDPEGTKEVWDTIKQLQDEKTLVIVEHKIEQVLDIIDRIIVFNEEGEIIADGPKDSILNQHLALFKKHGIWYPGVWEEYVQERTDEYQLIPTKQNSIITLKNFNVLRKKTVATHVQETTINSHDWIAVVGENGAGKSTLLQGLIQLLKTSGQYYLQGEEVHKKMDLSKKLAYVFQNPEYQFVTNSVYDEMAHSLRLDKVEENIVTEKTILMLERYFLLNHQHKHPYQLSMGQKRRLSVASSVMQKQPVLLLDEPTFGQDSKNTFALLQYLEQERKKGTAIVMVTHDNKIVSHFATRKWTISSGNLIDDCFIEKKKPTPLMSV
jgi:energy-coupling factor transport system ATP-binding protein